MYKNRLLLSFISSIIFIIGFFISNSFNTKEDKIRYVGFFPSPDTEITTVSLSGIDINKKTGEILLIEQRPSLIYRFGEDFNFKGEVSSIGRGPNEYLLANNALFGFDNNIIINDSGNNKIMILDSLGMKSSSFIPNKPIAEILVNKDEVIVFPLYSFVGDLDAR